MANLFHYYSALSVFSENMGQPQPIKTVIIKKCPQSLKIYGRVKGEQNSQLCSTSKRKTGDMKIITSQLHTELLIHENQIYEKLWGQSSSVG